MYSVLLRRCPQYLLELLTLNDDDSGRRCLRWTSCVVGKLFQIVGSHTDWESSVGGQIVSVYAEQWQHEKWRDVVGVYSRIDSL